MPPRHAAAERALIAASRFNEAVTRRLAQGAAETLTAAGVASDTVWVDGAWELPLLLDRGLATGRYRLAVAVGAIVRGETPHFDILAAEVARGLGHLALARGLPIGFGVLTCDTLEQALARAGGSHGNKGVEAASAALDARHAIDGLDAAG